MRCDTARGISAHPIIPDHPEWAENEHILKWWGVHHDALIAKRIASLQWLWYVEIFTAIKGITPEADLEHWKDTDPLCHRWAWQNILTNFARARAYKIGLTDKIREPRWRLCPLCAHEFREDSVRARHAKPLGVDKIDICELCLDSYAGSKVPPWDGSVERKDVITFLTDLTKQLEQIPSQNFGRFIADYSTMSTEQRVSVLKIMVRKPPIQSIKKLFGSWLHALVEAGLLDEGARPTARGTQCLADDGHRCNSYGEKTIDDILFSLQIAHEREPAYPGCKYRGDFLVNNTIIEFFGLSGEPEYDKKTKLKAQICKEFGINLLAIYPADLKDRNGLVAKISSTFLQNAD